jgi:hypothetical protein
LSVVETTVVNVKTAASVQRPLLTLLKLLSSVVEIADLIFETAGRY